MTGRQVRFDESFFAKLDELLPPERGADETPSASDFLVVDLPRLRDRLSLDFAGSALPTANPNERVLVSACSLFRGVSFHA